MFCSFCGTQVDNSAQYCPHCGTKFVQMPTASASSTEPLSPPGSPIPVNMPIPPPGIPVPASSRAVTSLILGIIGVIPCCAHIVAPIAWILGSMELKDINAGLSSPAGKGYATAGKILGIIGTIMIIISMLMAILWLVFAFSTFAFRAPFSHHFRPF